MGKKLHSTFLIGMLFLVVTFILCFFQLIDYASTPREWRGPSIILEFKKGISLKEMAQELKAAGVIKNPFYFILLTRVRGEATSLKAGEYEFISGVTPRNVLKDIVEGRVLKHTITFIPGWTFSQVMDALDKDPSIQHTLSREASPEILSLLRIPQKNPEGLFFPDTYEFTRGTKDVEILQRAAHQMKETLFTLWKERDKTIPYKNPYEVLIAASLIEKESGIPLERQLIAGVMENRFEKNMPLQMDPSVIYGLGENYHGALSIEDLQKDTPYNIYLRKGLPPTPIALPSKTAILAALHPTKNPYLYYVAKGQGEHQFSRTFGEHETAVQYYLHFVKESL